jgi:FAD/FMN-containing dehydrogenase
MGATGTRGMVGFRGEVLRPGDPAYDEARRLWNGAIDQRPAMIARCQGAADVVMGIEHARSTGLPLAVRGGGHNVAGTATCEGGIVLDLSSMKELRVDPDARTAWAGPGLLWGELDQATQAVGLATTGGIVTHTGVGGLTLHYLDELGDGAIDALVDHAWRHRSPRSYTIMFQLGGAVARIPDDATAFSGRGAGYALNINAVALDARERAGQTEWARGLWEATRPYSNGVYMNFLGNEGAERVRSAYGAAKYQRLVALKRAWDPDNLFRRNQNIPPG